MRAIEVVGLGALNMDYIYQVERILEYGETAVAKESISSPGGSAANTIYGLSKLGVKTGALGILGDDTEGGIMQQDFEKVGADTSRLYASITPVNSFRVVLNEYFGTELPLLPDRNYVLDSYEVVDVTGIVSRSTDAGDSVNPTQH